MKMKEIRPRGEGACVPGAPLRSVNGKKTSLVRSMTDWRLCFHRCLSSVHPRGGGGEEVPESLVPGSFWDTPVAGPCPFLGCTIVSGLRPLVMRTPVSGPSSLLGCTPSSLLGCTPQHDRCTLTDRIGLPSQTGWGTSQTG